MVLDESALEAMLARQRAAERSHEQAPAVRTVQTDEFEVYERRSMDEPQEPAASSSPTPAAAADRHDAWPSLRGPSQDAPHPSKAAPAAPEASATDFEELPGRNDGQDASPARGHPPSAAPVSAARPAQYASRPPQPVTRPPQSDARPPQSEARRPQVWPPIRPAVQDVRAEAATGGPPDSQDAADFAVDMSADASTDAPATPPARPRTHAPDASPVEGAVDGTGCRIAIVQATFNQQITDAMADQAMARAAAAGARTALHKVPGVYDLPLMVQHLARRKDVDAIVVIGCVVQGETKHDELITFTTAKTLQEISLATDTPIGLGIIGPGMSWQQAEARIGNGAHAVDAAVAMWRASLTA